MSDAPIDPWEEAYLRFETPEQEIRKFTKRLIRAGAKTWPRQWEIAELFCGRGSGLHALSQLGFTSLQGIDLSPRLISQYHGSAQVQVGDCRQLPLADQSLDAIIIQGGLHHLQSLPADLDLTLAEARRVLRTNGLIVIVEPWMTPFLATVHRICRIWGARQLSNKLDALQTMIEHERVTYESWLGRADQILALLGKYFRAEQREIGWGKLLFLGRRE